MSRFDRAPLWIHVEGQLRKLGIPFTKRRSSSSSYYECKIWSKIILIRVSDHPETKTTMTWPSDFNVVDRSSYKKMKNGLKRLQRSEAFEHLVAKSGHVEMVDEAVSKTAG